MTQKTQEMRYRYDASYASLALRNEDYKEKKMKESVYRFYDELPLFLSSEILSELLGISLSSCYELMHEKGFPVIRIGKRMVVEKSRFIEWVKNNTAGDRKC